MYVVFFGDPVARRRRAPIFDKRVQWVDRVCRTSMLWGRMSVCVFRFGLLRPRPSSLPANAPNAATWARTRLVVHEPRSRPSNTVVEMERPLQDIGAGLHLRPGGGVACSTVPIFSLGILGVQFSILSKRTMSSLTMDVRGFRALVAFLCFRQHDCLGASKYESP